METQRFESKGSLDTAVSQLLRNAFAQAAASEPSAVMLSGGATPIAAYHILALSPLPHADRAFALFSDERIVPPDSPESNYGNIAPMLRAFGVPDRHILQVETGRGTAEAAARFDAALTDFFANGGSIPLGILGLGADGHTASLFSLDDVKQGDGHLAIPISRPSGPDRVSVTPDLLARVGRIVFVVCGPEKGRAIERLLNQPDSIPAGRAVARCPRVEIWTA